MKNPFKLQLKRENLEYRPILGESSAKTVKGEKIGYLTAICYLVPDKNKRAEAQEQLQNLLTTQDFQIAVEQIKVNAIEAQSDNIFKSGWRPSVGWICSIAFQPPSWPLSGSIIELNLIASDSLIVRKPCLVNLAFTLANLFFKFAFMVKYFWLRRSLRAFRPLRTHQLICYIRKVKL